ncbi:hypothetical protein [Demequina capsici]|uniref:Lipoprotein n=1 Tax=Demequina capsici TaxID=3075620 RepID=A0AA96F6F7_9MICO|nr:hypothetical protein [Demequina sp. OYTSA14]WNM24199.1 hypothetical protein RN606_12660 [Demequina sp. OYTSA14]
MSRWLPAVHTSALVLTVAASLCACSSGSPQSSPDESSSASSSAVEAPDFEGPYAAEFASAYAAASSVAVRDALEDGEITDAEYAEMTDQFSSCLGDQGIEFGGFNADGGFQTTGGAPGADVESIVSECSHQVGEDSIGALYTLMAGNPENQDTATIMAACLVERGVEPAGYGADDYAADVSTWGDPTTMTDDFAAALQACNSDPLGLLGEQ